MGASECAACLVLRQERDDLLVQIAELTKLVDLQAAELARYRAASEADVPNQPERVPRNQLQLAFEEVLNTISDDGERKALEEAVAANDDGPSNGDDASAEASKSEPNQKRKKGGGTGPCWLPSPSTVTPPSDTRDEALPESVFRRRFSDLRAGASPGDSLTAAGTRRRSA